MLALLSSAALHALLLWPPLRWPQPAPQPPVILAELRQLQPQQPPLQPPSASAPVSTTAQPAPATPAPATSALRARPAAPATASPPPAVAAQPGLTVSKEAEASDPLEREYQQRLLAHLRNRLRAPAGLQGSVRLEIRFSYRQIASDVRVLRSSGNPTLDRWAVQAVLAANPLPPLPPALPDDYVFRPTLQTAP